MRKRLTMMGLLAALAAATVAGPAAAVVYETVAEGVADSTGAGTLQFEVDPGDPQGAIDSLEQNLALSNDAAIDQIFVEDGVAFVHFSGAPAGGAVTAALPESTILALGVTSSAGGATIAGLPAAGVIGGVLVVGGGVGIAAAVTDGFSGDDGPSGEGVVASPAQ